MKTDKIKAIVCTKYGSPDVLQIQEVERPIPTDNEVLIKVMASSVTAADSMMRRANPFISRFFLGFTKPKNAITGTGFAGIVETVGKDVGLFKKGDQVFGESLLNFGANAEYVSIPEDGVLTTKPSNMTFDEAAPVCDGALTSLNFLRDMAKSKKGQKVLINGASGSLGTSAVQLAKYFRAEVTGVCSSKNLEMVKALGADIVIDYTKDDFTKTDQTYDIIYDTIGNSSFSKCKGSLTDTGIYMSPVLNLKLLLQMLKTSVIGGKRAKFSATGIRLASELRNLLLELKGLIEADKIKSVVDQRYHLEQIVEAHRYVDRGHKKGNVILTMR